MDFSKMSPKEKKQAITAIILLPLTIVVFVIGFLSNDPDDAPSPQKTEQVAKSNKAKTNAKSKSADGAESKEETAKVKTDASSLKFLAEKLNIPETNPFVEISNLVKAKKEADKEGMAEKPIALANIPAITLKRTNPAPANIPVPIIPPRKTVQSAQNRKSTTQNNEPKTVAVQGVLTGEDGKNMAIMSDGRVVSEGDVYGDGRIAFIGGDGIQFDNGKTMQYK